MNGFGVEQIEVMLDDGAIMPTKAHEDDAGFDLYTRYPYCLYTHSSALFDTGVHIAIPKGYVGFLKSKSGLNCKYGIVGEGVIDSGYTGPIIVKLYNNSYSSHFFEAGDKISQIVFLPIPNFQLKQVESLDDTDRGDKGFGSSGR